MKPAVHPEFLAALMKMTWEISWIYAAKCMQQLAKLGLLH